MSATTGYEMICDKCQSNRMKLVRIYGHDAELQCWNCHTILMSGYIIELLIKAAEGETWERKWQADNANLEK